MHGQYRNQGELYADQKLAHALSIYKSISGINLSADTKAIRQLLEKSVTFRKQLADRIHESRAKDYQNPFRAMVYGSEDELNKVVGDLRSNSFIQEDQKACRNTRQPFIPYTGKFQCDDKPVTGFIRQTMDDK